MGGEALNFYWPVDLQEEIGQLLFDAQNMLCH